MGPELVLLIGALFCVLGVAAAAFVGIKYRNEDWAFITIFIVLMCCGGAAWCVHKAVEVSAAREGIKIDLNK